MWEGEEAAPGAGGPTPKQRLLNWIQGKCADLPIHNFTTDWNDGRAIGALVDACGPGQYLLFYILLLGLTNRKSLILEFNSPLCTPICSSPKTIFHSRTFFLAFLIKT